MCHCEAAQQPWQSVPGKPVGRLLAAAVSHRRSRTKGVSLRASLRAWQSVPCRFCIYLLRCKALSYFAVEVTLVVARHGASPRAMSLRGRDAEDIIPAQYLQAHLRLRRRQEQAPALRGAVQMRLWLRRQKAAALQVRSTDFSTPQSLPGTDCHGCYAASQ